MKPHDNDDQPDTGLPADMDPDQDDDEIGAALLMRAQLIHIHRVNNVPFYLQ